MNTNILKTRAGKLLLAAVVLSAGGLGAAPLAMADPISPSPTITSGPLTFSNFTCSVTGGSGLSCSDISVVGYVSTSPPDAIAGENGIQIQGAFSAYPTTEDVAITYNATVAGGVFSDAEMHFNGTAVSSISEYIYNTANGDLIGSLLVTNPPLDLNDTTLLSENATSIFVEKDISLNLTTDEVAGTISLVDQNYSITVPEPGTFALLGVGLLGCAIGLARWRRRPMSED